jgi:methionyl-tRNA synthetase
MADPFYITTPIYYVNAPPHLGTFYATVVADALARYQRASGRQTFFLTGTDEHGQKIERMASERGQDPKTYCDAVAATFKASWQRAEISYDRFIRTTDDDHRAAVEDMWRRMAASGDIYLADYDGLYCVGCEDWKSEDETVTEGGARLCGIHRRPVEPVKERNFFFRLSRYADRLLALYRQGAGDFIRPASRANEVIAFVERGLRDISVSRTTIKWGIPVPGDPGHVIYVWIDALTNYLTALGGPGAVASGSGPAAAWWSRAHHLIGKDILRFHAVYWPAMLMAAGLPPPRAILCSGYLTVKGQKISKSLPATRVDPNVIADELGMDPLRYFVLREYSLGADGDFTYESLFQRYESDLGNDLGNLLNRTLTMARQLGNELEAVGPTYTAHDPLAEQDLDLRGDVLAACREATAAWEALAPARALDATWAMIRRGNVHIDRTAPWQLKKAGQLSELRSVLASTLEVVRRAAVMVAPVMPAAAREILRQIGRAGDEMTWPADDWTGWPGGALAEPKPVFPRLEAAHVEALIARWTGEHQVAAGAATSATAPSKRPAGATRESNKGDGEKNDKPEGVPAPAPPGLLSIDDFRKLDLRAARVVAARRVPGSDKLLQLELDAGGEARSVVAGIGGAYDPAALLGRTVIYLANLKPAKIRGVVSQGMILAAGDETVVALAAFDREPPPGTKIR